MPGPFKIIDISQPVTSKSACFPGDVPFSKKITVSYEDSNVINLTALTMSPHVGTHADAPIHCYGNLEEGHDTVGEMPLQPFIGPAVVVDLSPLVEAISVEHFRETIEGLPDFPHRVLFKTAKKIRYDVFEENYSYFAVEAVKYLAERGVGLIGIDTPSVDHVGSKSLDAHAALIAAKMCWLENLDLTNVEPGEYFLVAAPLRFMELEASPVRAILIESDAV